MRAHTEFFRWPFVIHKCTISPFRGQNQITEADMSLNLGNLLANSRQCYGSETALIFQSERCTYDELETRVRRFAAELLNVGVERGDKVAIMVPNGPPFTIAYFAILHDVDCQRADLSSLRFWVSGGAPMPVKVKGCFEERFGVKIQDAYGLTETSPLATIQRPNETKECGTIGRPNAGIELKVFDDDDREVAQGERGEIVMRGHNIMKGFYKKPEATAEAMRNGWFHWGDIGYIDEEGESQRFSADLEACGQPPR